MHTHGLQWAPDGFLWMFKGHKCYDAEKVQFCADCCHFELALQAPPAAIGLLVLLFATCVIDCETVPSMLLRFQRVDVVSIHTAGL